MTEPACRFCRAPLGLPVLDLGSQPLSNAYLSPADLAAGRERSFPLRLRVCACCLLVQVDDSVPPKAIFDGDYAYFSSFSESWLAHCRRYAADSVARFGLGPTSQVLEVASNDGYLLQFFADAGVPVLGIEPTANTAAVAQAKGVPTEVRFFDEATGRDLAARGFAADLVHGANVLAHVPDIRGFVAGFPHVLKADGTLTLEFPHLLCMIERVQFDTIYHEHFSYLSLLVVEAVLGTAGLRVYDVERLQTHGGSLRLFCCHVEAPFIEAQAVDRLRLAEREAGLADVATYTTFAARVDDVRRAFVTFLDDARRDGLRVAAYGAAAKGNTFLNSCGTTAEDVVCVFDRSPHKQGKLLPGSHVPVLDPAKASEVRPDLLLILPWNLRTEIMRQMDDVRRWGCRFVTVAPEVEVTA
ncbi:class I SAM-dependent methyltransferase [Lichenibacterium ramalinae]|uniref:Methyltransferase domain-containing protein n=1 Tax=Lichenibacterium ramalinae TaxID=2316527 RepID=A0A4V1RI37_9HYPH|nr:class I SAM-dependent methyltransferase [Lichenibacterium ramalinae]RYB02189.1 methyltransferase domain-containing protein [Lichenibacterium ramalinae]